MKRYLYSGIAAATVLSGVAAFSTSAQAAPAVRLSANPLGVNVSPRQTTTPAVMAKIDAQLRAIGPVSIRYGGGTLADTYFYNVNRDTYDCTEKWTSNPIYSCSRADSLTLAQEDAYAASIGAKVMPIVNYGSGTPALAAGMATGASSIELGNEPYGCDSIINELELPPTNDTGYEHGTKPNCPYYLYGGGVPGIIKMGQSFNVYAPGFISAIKAASPGTQVELPYAISPAGNSGYAWNDTVMPALRGQYSGIVVLDYPYYGRSVISDAAALNGVIGVPAAAAKIRADIARYSPGATWQIGETNSTNANNNITCRWTGGVFAASNALSWLAAGASNVDWWDETDTQNTATCAHPDFGMFSSTGVAQPPYWGYIMASKLAQPGGTLAPVATGNKSFLEFYATYRGHQAVAYIDLSTKVKMHVRAFPLANANMPTYTYGAAGRIIGSHTKQSVLAKNGVTVVPASMVVFTR